MADASTCFIHVCEEESEALKPMTFKNWEKIKTCGELWRSLDGKEKEVASSVNNLPGFKEDGGEKMFPENSYFYHKKCYIKYTNLTSIERAKKRVKKYDVPSDTFPTAPHYSKRPRTSSDRSQIGIFPNACLICDQVQYFVERNSGKRKQEKLVKCQTFAANKALLNSALRKKDMKIICKIQDVDCIAKEVKYHKSCYKCYTKVVSCHPSDVVQPHEAGYSAFRKIVDERIINKCEILSMNKLSKMFVDSVMAIDTGTCEVSNRQLKRWLQRDYPQLSFVKPKQRNMSELVLYRDNSDEIVIIDQDEINNESTDTDGASEMVNEIPKFDSYQNESNSILYKAALVIKNLIVESPPIQGVWPPTADEVNKVSVQGMVPIMLFNFLAWCVGATEEFSVDECVQTVESTQRKLLSIAQDLIYLQSRGKKQTLKHLSLAMAVRHVTGSSKIIGLLNGLGHSISHTAVLEYDTALAEMQLKLTDSIPSGIIPKQPVTLVWDNIDFCEETVTGHNTTHYTNGIIIQKGTNVAITNEFTNKSGIKSRKRTIDPPMSLIFNYSIGERCNPEIMSEVITCSDKIKYLKEAKLVDAVYIFSKCYNNKHPLPGWTGYNCMLEKDHVSPPSTVRYLPVLEANPTEFSTVNAILRKSIEVADAIGIEEMVLVFDQAIYAKAQQIRWKDDIFKKRVVIRLGEFHIIMAFFAILGKRFRDAGLASIMVESGIVAEGSVNGVLNGKHYNRSIRCHKLVFEALSRLLWATFLNSMSDDQFSQSLKISKQLCDLFQINVLRKEEIPADFIFLVERFDEFVTKGCKSNATFAFWVSYLDMVGTLLNFLRATRSADWFLHLAATEEMIPWFFCYDHVNYARYLPIYLLEMLNLKSTHPSVNDQLCSGDFVTQRQHAFSGTAMDQTIEQTANRDSKTKGGLTGFTKNSGAVHRWMLSHHMRAQISISCEKLAGKHSNQNQKKDLSPSQVKMHETFVNNVEMTITSMINPFTWHEDVLVNISSGAYATKEIQHHLYSAKELGRNLYLKYCKERLHKHHNIDIHSKITQQKLQTFSDINKKAIKNETQKVSLKNNTDILARIIVMGQSASLDMRYILTFNLNDFPPAIANADGSLVKTNKATLIHSVLGLVDKSITCANLAFSNTLILDGMAILQQMQNIPSTFSDLAMELLKYVIDLSIRYQCRSVHFVTDTYPLISIKENERKRRGDGGEIAIHIKSPCQKTPKQFKKFLSNGKNKESLSHFIYEQWSTFNYQIFKNVSVFISHGQACHNIHSENGIVCTKEVSELFSDHVEADTKMLLHAYYASKYSSAVIIKSSDTDVFVITLAMCQTLNIDIYMLLGTSSNSQLENISELSKVLGDEFCSALIGLHIFTGCDTCSAFKGKGKVKPLNLMQSNPRYMRAFQDLGSSWDLTDSLIQCLEAFVCELYALPPNFDSLLLHIKRCNYQACIHRKCIIPNINAPSPSGNGWLLDANQIQITWNTMPSVPECLIKHVSCSCLKTACTTKQCSCKASNVTCTDACSCINCINNDVNPDNGDAEDDSDEETGYDA